MLSGRRITSRLSTTRLIRPEKELSPVLPGRTILQILQQAQVAVLAAS
jgi:hypothetical protein